MPATRQAFIGAGANLGSREATLRSALEQLRRTPGVERAVTSPVYETEPLGLVDQPRFLNLVVGIETTLSPEELLARLQQIEREHGRERLVRWGPRTLDLDLLAFEGETRSSEFLTLPHPRMFERAFVTVPLRQAIDAFDRSRWAELRARLTAAPADEKGVWLYREKLLGPDVALPADVAGYLGSLKQRGVTLGLERMNGFLSALGQPQNQVPAIHVAGTNGKGSVAAMLEAILRRAGWRTGLYTSPHLIRLGERIRVDGVAIENAALAEAVRALRPIAEAQQAAAGTPSYFEFMTGLAFRHFGEAGCDIAIIEAGLGGRLDATNVLTPEISVITSIGLDHRELLGDTLAAIAREKAGIIKPSRPVVMGRMPEEAQRVIEAEAARAGSALTRVESVEASNPVNLPTTNLRGAYQRWNAATAAATARLLDHRWRIDEAAIAVGLGEVNWPGRWQQLHVAGRTVVVDSSHNEEGAASLDAELTTLAAKTGAAPVVVIGVLGVVRANPLMAVVARHAQEIWLVEPRQPRACRFAELATLIPTSYHGPVRRTTIEAVFPEPNQCSNAIDLNVPVVVTGSIYLAGEALVRIDPSRGPLESELEDF